MGYKIYVDHSRFSNGSKKINEYIGTMDSYMATMNDSVNDMMNSWKGDDATAFNSKWQDNSGTNSVTSNMKSSLKKYADNLNVAAEKYKNAQATSINEAASLPKW